MPYIIDGHNLIANTPGISLADPDDELRLMLLLRAFCIRSQKHAMVYFDRRAPGHQDPPPMGDLRVHFVRPPRTADEAICEHLTHLGPEAKNWTVVSSDRQVVAAARQVGARSIKCYVFAAQLAETSSPQDTNEKPSLPISPEELAAWQKLFDQEDRDG